VKAAASLALAALLLFGKESFAQTATLPPPVSTFSIYNDVRAGKTETGTEVHALTMGRGSGAIEKAQAEGRWYTVDEKLGKPEGFGFFFSNNRGLYEMGDKPALGDRARITVVSPKPASIVLIKDTSVVAEAEGDKLEFPVKEPGRYRTVISLAEGAGRKEWIRSQVITVTPGSAPLNIEPATPGKVQQTPNIAYIAGSTNPKQQLDLYRPEGTQPNAKLPVLIFVHGGYWRGGDKAQYVRFGQRYASEKRIVVIPSYRLQPAAPHPAQIEDVAAAYAWVVKNIATYGGDPSNIYLAGHSAGAHLVSLLATDPGHLLAKQVTPAGIKGVISISGVYDVRRLPEYFSKDDSVRDQASPLAHIRKGLPPFQILWAQWDFPFLPAQAKQFHQELEKAGSPAEILYVPGEDHNSIIISSIGANTPVSRAILKMVR
jgi:acetyl esterase/lipase